MLTLPDRVSALRSKGIDVPKIGKALGIGAGRLQPLVAGQGCEDAKC